VRFAGNVCWSRGEFTTIAELADREGIALSYMTRVLRITLLAPDVVESILIGQHGREITLATLMNPFPLDWSDQGRAYFSVEQLLRIGD